MDPERPVAFDPTSRRWNDEALKTSSPDLDWVAFRARYFPGTRPRHDFQASVAYSATFKHPPRTAQAATREKPRAYESHPKETSLGKR
jgi:hypothetical protein